MRSSSRDLPLRLALSAVLLSWLAACEPPPPRTQDKELQAHWQRARQEVDGALKGHDFDRAQAALERFDQEIARAEGRGVATSEDLERARQFLGTSRERIETTRITAQIDDYLDRGSFPLARSFLRLCLYSPASSEERMRFCEGQLGRVETAQLDAVERQVEEDLARESYDKTAGYLGLYLNAGEFSDPGLERLEGLLARAEEARQVRLAGHTPPVPPPHSSPPTVPLPSPPAPAPPPPALSSIREPEVAGLRFVEVASGRYQIGTPPGEPGRDPVLEPEPRIVAVETFFISTTEVTQESYVQIVPRIWKHFSGPRFPAHSVNYADAEEFCRRLSEEDGRMVFSLPTEIEWEVAVRALLSPSEGPVVGQPKHRERFQGDLDRAALTLQSYALFRDNKTGSGPIEVGQKSPNRFRLYDMHGNVAEWTRRVPELEGWYRGSLVEQPLRGGSFLSAYERCRAGARALEPEATRRPTIGFRIVARPR
ncbi:MAG: formylglycine-generating enzyme family protein [bacterium]|nr:formylglycine-generating enzyme family protein [bacterium]